MNGRPTVAEERWIEVGRRLRDGVDPSRLADRTGGWRITGALARVALLVLGVVATALVAGILGLGNAHALVGGGVAAIAGAEYLIRDRRLYASGFEEGLWAAGSLLIALWLHGQLLGDAYSGDGMLMLSIAIAAGAAGLRLGNPFVVLLGVLALVDWLARQPPALALDALAGRPIAALVIAVAIAALALAAGGRWYQRPSSDRMLDWIAAGVPVVAWVGGNGWMTGVQGGGTPSLTRLPAIALLAGLAVAALVTGLRRRRHGPLLCGMLAGACAAIEAARSTGWPAEALLTAGGVAALALGAVLERRLREPWRGYTSAPTDGGSATLDLVGAAVAGAQVPAAGGPAAAEPERGGRFGGGGASGGY